MLKKLLITGGIALAGYVINEVRNQPVTPFALYLIESFLRHNTISNLFNLIEIYLYLSYHSI